MTDLGVKNLMHGNKCVYIQKEKAFEWQHFSFNTFWTGNSNTQMPGKENQ